MKTIRGLLAIENGRANGNLKPKLRVLSLKIFSFGVKTRSLLTTTLVGYVRQKPVNRRIYFQCQRKTRHANIYDAMAEAWRLERQIPFKEFIVYKCDVNESSEFHYHVGSLFDAKDAKRILKRVKKMIRRLLKSGIPKVPEELLRIRAQMEGFLRKGSWRLT